MPSNPPSGDVDVIPAVSALVWHQGRLLLVRRKTPPLDGMWALPGGRIEAGESPETAVVREVREETGIRIVDPVAVDTTDVVDAGGCRRYEITVFAARFAGGLPAAGDDAADARWLGPAQLRQLPVADQTLAVIARHAERTDA
jgi:8-oxo-dGTP diphosphatase